MFEFLDNLINFLQASKKNWAVLEKINGPLFFRFDNCGPLVGGLGANSPMPSFLEPAGILRFFVIKYLTLNLIKCLLTAETFAFIHWQALDVRKTKCTEKFLLKLDLEIVRKLKFFQLSICGILFSYCFKTLK